VLYAGPSHGLQHPFLSAGNGRRATYATLNYCWAVLADSTITLSNMAELQTKIDLLTLPQTFQDVTRVARELCIPFLWIDALCIIQDLEPDWEQQSAVTSDIYRNCLIVIPADGGDNVSAECSKNPLGNWPCRSPKDFPPLIRSCCN
jgi:hypothetical protein